MLQTGTVAEYQGEFEKLMNRATDIPESLLISFYISGLKLSLQQKLLVLKPTTLGNAFALARVTEARLEIKVRCLWHQKLGILAVVPNTHVLHQV